MIPRFLAFIGMPIAWFWWYALEQLAADSATYGMRRFIPCSRASPAGELKEKYRDGLCEVEPEAKSDGSYKEPGSQSCTREPAAGDLLDASTSTAGPDGYL